jgi:hypothetical protein
MWSGPKPHCTQRGMVSRVLPCNSRSPNPRDRTPVIKYHHSMKKLPMIGSSVAILAACCLPLWWHIHISRFDTTFLQNLAGTWSSNLDNMRFTNAVSHGGGFICQLIFIHHARTNSYQEIGSWVVTDGKLIETVISDTNPTALTPRSRVGRIIHADAREFTVNWHGSPDFWVWQKITP